MSQELGNFSTINSLPIIFWNSRIFVDNFSKSENQFSQNRPQNYSWNFQSSKTILEKRRKIAYMLVFNNYMKLAYVFHQFRHQFFIFHFGTFVSGILAPYQELENCWTILNTIFISLLSCLEQCLRISVFHDMVFFLFNLFIKVVQNSKSVLLHY